MADFHDFITSYRVTHTCKAISRTRSYKRLKWNLLAIVAHILNSSTLETGRQISEFQDSQGDIIRPCLKIK
ncbi:hypothetical protein I79_009412 [Cricetulus griseus]|uniref:Uncharacterized protein n=1 Tax=Cricetulus griseus TaxID=10029 RepID=G3HFP9_CRIGR|nr:hypothetical protein I79_009412 [Cricetulus griseus]